MLKNSVIKVKGIKYKCQTTYTLKQKEIFKERGERI